MILELAVFHPDSIQVAIAAGINRIELCDDYSAGGLTPSAENFQNARRKYKGQIFTMVRPRTGDFIYSDEEFEIMLRQVDAFAKAGTDGIVSGFLLPDGGIHEEQLSRFVEACHPLPFTFHRAFDRAADWKSNLDSLIRCGCSRVLSSGGTRTAAEGKQQLKEMTAYAAGKLIVLPGGGIRSDNIAELIFFLKPAELHTAAIHPDSIRTGEYIADIHEVGRLLSFT